LALINNKNKLGFIHIPKCAGSSVRNYLHKIGKWEELSFDYATYASQPFENLNEIDKLFTVVRHPLSWVISGFKFFKQRNQLSLSFEEHVDKMIAEHTLNLNDADFDWFWHCKVLPDAHIGNFNPKVFKVEEINKLPVYLSQWFPNANTINIDIENKTMHEKIFIEKHTLEKIKKYTGAYADKFEYEF